MFVYFLCSSRILITEECLVHESLILLVLVLDSGNTLSLAMLRRNTGSWQKNTSGWVTFIRRWGNTSCLIQRKRQLRTSSATWRILSVNFRYFRSGLRPIFFIIWMCGSLESNTGKSEEAWSWGEAEEGKGSARESREKRQLLFFFASQVIVLSGKSEEAESVCEET